jgi:dUTP pyrophosphatase
MKIKFRRLNENAVVPVFATKGAACADVVATEIVKQDSYNVTVKLGFATEIPEGYKGVVVPRSSFTQKGWVMQNSPAQIDSDYRGEWMLKFQSLTFDAVSTRHNLIDLLPEDFPYEVGDRVAQVYFEKVEQAEFVVVDDLEFTERGEGGFGSTGVKEVV